MQKLEQQLTAENKITIADRLEKFFILKGRSHDTLKIGAFTDSLCAGYYSYPEILAGIDSLSKADLSKTQILDIALIQKEIEDKRALKNMNANDNSSDKIKCFHCLGSGTVTLLLDNFYQFAFACFCSAGYYDKNKILPRWTGKDEFFYNEKVYTVPKWKKETMAKRVVST